MQNPQSGRIGGFEDFKDNAIICMYLDKMA